MLEVNQLSVQLGGRSVLQEVNLKLDQGQFMGLIGPNGAGKTTLLRAILGLVPSSGTITWQGQRIDRRTIGYVPQRHAFAWDFPINVRQVVLSGLTGRLGWLRRPRPEHLEAADCALEQVSMSDLRSRPVEQLSGGQRQRVLVARALALKPQLLLLDEPFTGLDMPTQELLTDLFKELSQAGVAVLMSTHDLVAAQAQCEYLCLLNCTDLACAPPSQLKDKDLWMRTFQVRADNPLLQALGMS